MHILHCIEVLIAYFEGNVTLSRVPEDLLQEHLVRFRYRMLWNQTHESLNGRVKTREPGACLVFGSLNYVSLAQVERVLMAYRITPPRTVK